MNSDDLIIYHGEAYDTLARVYVEYSAHDATDCEIVGQVVGPRCEYAKTLPARMSLRMQSGGNVIRAEAIVPDPCFWSPRMPQLYDVQIEVRCGDKIICSAERPLGIRRLGPRGESLFLEGTRWVMRGVSEGTLPESDANDTELLQSCHDAEAALLISDASDELLESASRLGTLLLVQVTGSSDEIARQLNRLSRYPVAIAVIRSESASVVGDLAFDATAKEKRPRNLLLAQHVKESDAEPLAPWAQMVLVEGQEASRIAERAKAFSLPVIAYRPAAAGQGVLEDRKACDHLQRDLAPHGDFAGYIV